MFRSARKSRRCFIPAIAYYGWREFVTSEKGRQDAVLRRPRPALKYGLNNLLNG
jgi:putative SOS response-associated peptidase YedK